MRFNFSYAILVLLLLIGALFAAEGKPAGSRTKRQTMEQIKPWMEWGMKYGEIMGTTVVIPAAQEAASIASAGRGGGDEEGQGSR